MSGKFTTDRLTYGSAPHRVSTEFSLAAAQGAIVGARTENRYAANDDVGTTLETLWDFGGIYPTRTSAETLKITSTSTADAIDGVGARAITIYGLDADYNLAREVVELSGLTAVETSTQFLRNDSMKVSTVGASGEAIGNIYAGVGAIASTGVPDTTYALIRRQVDHSEGATLMGVYTVPAGKTAYITHWTGSVGKGKDCEVEIYLRPFEETWQCRARIFLYQGSFDTLLNPMPDLFEKTDIEVRAKTSVGTIAISVGFDFILIDN